MHDVAAAQAIEPRELAGAVHSKLVFSGAIPHLFGILPVRLQSGKRAAIKVSKPPSVVHEASRLHWDVGEGWVAECWHVDRAATELDTVQGARLLLEEAIQALNVATQWIRVRETVTGPERVAPWLRRFGRVDVKGAVHWDPSDRIAVFINPHKPLPLDLNSLIPMIGNMIVSNGPLAQPTSGMTDRWAGALDLLNHGFTTEAVLIAFSAFEAAVRRALSVELGLPTSEDDRSGISSRIRKASFRQCLFSLPKEAGWQAIDAFRTGLGDEMMVVYDGRNQLIHEARSADRTGAEWSLHRLWDATSWVRAQRPDVVAPLPPSNAAVPEYFVWRPGDPPLAKPESDEDRSNRDEVSENEEQDMIR